MQYKVYLHRQIIDILSMYGDLSDVVNKILSYVEEGEINIETLPSAPSRDKAYQVTIDITNEYYLSLLTKYSIYSGKNSLRRLLYWFVENEKYDEYNFVKINDFVNSAIKKPLNHIKQAEEHITKLLSYNNTEEFSDKITTILNDINSLKNSFK